jgi:hypothetical protein
MVRRIAHIVLVGLLAATCCSGALAQWKWRDASGEMHVSDRPPPADVPDKSILQRPNMPKHVNLVPTSDAPDTAASAAASAPHASGVDPELQARMKRAEQEREAKQKAVDEKNAAIKADNCKRAQAALRTLDSGTRLTRVNEKGEREFLDDSQRASERQRAQDMVTSNCH